MQLEGGLNKRSSAMGLIVGAILFDVVGLAEEKSAHFSRVISDCVVA